MQEKIPIHAVGLFDEWAYSCSINSTHLNPVLARVV